MLLDLKYIVPTVDREAGLPLGLKGCAMPGEGRSNERRKFGYYLPVVELGTLDLFGYLANVSPRGFKMDSVKPHGVNRDYDPRVDLPEEISSKPYINFIPRVMWIHPDPIDPATFHEGYKIQNISTIDEGIFNKMMDNYARPGGK